MIQRGRPRKDAAAEKVVKLVASSFDAKPEPPEELTPEAAEIWTSTVQSEPRDFLATGAQLALLKDYCRHRATADKVSTIIDLFQADWLKSKDGIKRYADLCKVRDAEGRAAADKATKLRLTNQSRWQPVSAARLANNTPKGKMPWEE